MLFIFFFAQAQAIDASSAVSVGLLLVVIGAAWRLSSLLTEVKMGVKAIAERQVPLDALPARVSLLEQRTERVEDDVDALWKVTRKAAQQ